MILAILIHPQTLETVLSEVSDKLQNKFVAV